MYAIRSYYELLIFKNHYLWTKFIQVKQFRVYIAFLLLSVFIYPVLFQSVHSIHKHRHEINSCCNTHNNNIRVNSTETISIPDNEFVITSYSIHYTKLYDGANVAKEYNTTYDRLVVIDKQGNIAYKGITNAAGDVDYVKQKVDMLLAK